MFAVKILLKFEITSVFYVKKTIRFTVSNRFFLFNPGMKQISKQQIWIDKIMNIKMCVELSYTIYPVFLWRGKLKQGL